MTFEKIHEVGARRHPHRWFTANTHAISAIRNQGFKVDDERIKTLVSEIVLRVLDVVKEGADD